MAEKHPNELTHAELAEWEAHAEAEWRKAGVEFTTTDEVVDSLA